MTNRRSSACIAVVLLCAISTVLSCNSKNDGGPTAPPPAPPPPPPPTWTSLVGRSTSVNAGIDGGYDCTQIQVPSDLYIKGFRSTVPAGVFRMYLTVSDSVFQPYPLGNFSCSAGVLNDRALYVGGVGTPDFAFPAGVGVHVKAGQYLLLTIQEYNPTAASESGTAEVSFEAGTAADVTQNADVLVAGRRQYTVLTGSSTVQGGCSDPENFQIVGLFTVMNLVGVSQRIRIATGPSAVTIQDTAYTAAHMEHTLIQPAYTVHKDDQIIVDCRYDNTTGAVIPNGDLATTEACFNWIYRYPAPDSADSFSCITD